MKIKDILQDRAILIWGYGREGKSTENFIKTHCQVKSLEIFEGKEEDIDPDKYDYILKSPGIAPKKPNPKYISQTKVRRSASQAPRAKALLLPCSTTYYANATAEVLFS